MPIADEVRCLGGFMPRRAAPRVPPPHSTCRGIECEPPSLLFSLAPLSMSKGGEGAGEGALKTGHMKEFFDVIVVGDCRTAARGICGALLAPPRHFELLKFSKVDFARVLRKAGSH